MKGRRSGFFVLVTFVVVGAACTSWYALRSSEPASIAAPKHDRGVRNGVAPVPQQAAVPEQSHRNGSSPRAGGGEASTQTNADLPQLGIRGRSAPSLQIERWYNLSGGRRSTDVTHYRGKVIYLYCFQSWCPGCRRYGFPALTELIEHYKGNDDMAFIAVQTTFEGFATNTPERGKETADQYGLTIPVGHSGSPQQPSALMRRYRTGGTPWTVIIDREGTVQFNDFHIQAGEAIALIDRLLRGS